MVVKKSATLQRGEHSARVPASPDWDAWFTKLEGCRSLKEGWNGYTAPAPAPVSIDNARMFLQAMREDDYAPTRLAPSAMGGVAVTRKAGDKKVLVEFYNDGRTFALFSARHSDMQVTPVAVDPSSSREFLVKMRDYLDG